MRAHGWYRLVRFGSALAMRDALAEIAPDGGREAVRAFVAALPDDSSSPAPTDAAATRLDLPGSARP